MYNKRTAPRKPDAVLSSLHPDCPDWMSLGPNASIAAIRAAAEANDIAAQQRDEAWSHGFNRRTFLKGGLGVGVAALATQLVTTRVAYADPGTVTNGTLVVIFLRGGMDGLSLLIPTNAADAAILETTRPDIGIFDDSRIKFGDNWALHPAMAPLQPLITAGKVAAIPAVSTPDLSRSHFQAQDCLERGTVGSETSGWLDRVLDVSGPGTTFRSVAVGGLVPRSLMGDAGSIAMEDLASMSLDVDAGQVSKTTDALNSLYTGIDHPISVQTVLAIEALGTVAAIKASATPSTVTYPTGNVGDALSSLATLIKANIGVKVACVDIGGWDTHTGMGNIDKGDMKDNLSALATSLAAFTSDLGDDLDQTTIVTMSEFGRRLQQNASNGTDHGHGGVVLVMGGGVIGGVHGSWAGLSADALDQGDVAGVNDYRDVLSEVVTKRLGLSDGSMSSVFLASSAGSTWNPTPISIMSGS
jgi:uncharacterized protein (DUF1501 family)